ncbi:hypothetical protein BD414DRAFT_189721 [Trametes punicea]|nr:hypothetical protein BD414DRAFT_189721 [Trametes punicea]
MGSASSRSATLHLRKDSTCQSLEWMGRCICTVKHSLVDSTRLTRSAPGHSRHRPWSASSTFQPGPQRLPFPSTKFKTLLSIRSLIRARADGRSNRSVQRSMSPRRLDTGVPLSGLFQDRRLHVVPSRTLVLHESLVRPHHRTTPSYAGHALSSFSRAAASSSAALSPLLGCRPRTQLRC